MGTIEFISGVALGIEYVNGAEVGEESTTHIVMIELFILRIIIEWSNK